MEKKRLDCFEKGKLIPHFPLELKLKSLNDPQPFSQKICFLTGIEPSRSITLTRDLFSGIVYLLRAFPGSGCFLRITGFRSWGRGSLSVPQTTYINSQSVNSSISQYINQNKCVHAANDDLFDVKTELLPVVAKWKDIGLALRLDPSQLDEIESNNRNSSDCLTRVLTLWLKKTYNTERFGEPSWELLARAVAHPAGGNNPALAEEMSHKSKNKAYMLHFFDTSLFLLHSFTTKVC